MCPLFQDDIISFVEEESESEEEEEEEEEEDKTLSFRHHSLGGDEEDGPEVRQQTTMYYSSLLQVCVALISAHLCVRHQILPLPKTILPSPTFMNCVRPLPLPSQSDIGLGVEPARGGPSYGSRGYHKLDESQESHL